MSGGSMDYAYYKINDAADYVQHQLADVMFKKKNGVLCQTHPYDVEKHPELEYLKTDEGLTDKVIELMQEALRTMRRAAIYARRVEWLTSGDDGYGSFCIRTGEELSECDRHNGAQ